MNYSRDGTSTFPEIAAFLGAIAFTGLILLFQQRSEFDKIVFNYTISKYAIQITEIQIIAFPLSMAVIVFIFSSIFFGIVCTKKDDSLFNIMAKKSFLLFITGFIFLFMSIFIVLYLIDFYIFIIGIIVSIIIFIWWWMFNRSLDDKLSGENK